MSRKKARLAFTIRGKLPRTLPASGQISAAHGGQGGKRTRGTGFQACIGAGRSLAAFRDSPHDERLAAAHVAGSENPGNRRHVVLVGSDIATVVELNSQLLDHSVSHRTEEAHGNQNQVNVHGEFGARYRLELRGRADPHGVKLSEVA